MDKKRILWVDMARGLAIALVVLAHSPIPHKLDSYIYSFHVPLFFIISGFLLHDGLNKKWKDFIKNKFVRLAIPYLFFSAITFIYWLVMRQTGLDPNGAFVNPATPVNGTLMAIRNSDFMVHNEALWFITSLFAGEVLFYGIYRLVKGDRMLLGMMLFLTAIVGILYNAFIKTPLPWSVDIVPIVVVFIGLGFFIKEYYAKWLDLKASLRTKVLVLIGLFVVNVLAWHFNPTSAGSVDMFYSLFGNFVLYFTAALAGSLMIMLFFESFLMRSKLLTYLGQNSLIIYALHQKVIFYSLGVLLLHAVGRVTPFAANSSFARLVNGLSYLLITLIALVPAVWLLNKYCAPFIGRWNLKKHRVTETAALGDSAS
jgi:acyltransferase